MDITWAVDSSSAKSRGKIQAEDRKLLVIDRLKAMRLDETVYLPSSDNYMNILDNRRQ